MDLSRLHAPLARLALPILLLAGWAITALGLSKLSGIDAFSWADRQALFRFAGTAVLAVVLLACMSRVRWKNGQNAVLLAALFSVAAGAIWPMLAIVALCAAAWIVGRAVLRRLSNEAEPDWLLAVLGGFAVYGTAVGLLVHLPINTTGLYGGALVLPLVAGRHELAALWRRLEQSGREPESGFERLGGLLFGAFALVHLVAAFFPETGADALAMHLFVPAQVAAAKQWSFDVDSYVWAVMPMFGDWLYTIAYVLAGETAARLLNVFFLVVLANCVGKMARWAGATTAGARFAMLLLISTPLAFTISSTLFIETIWASFACAGILMTLRVCESDQRDRAASVIAGLMLGVAMAAKLLTLMLLPGLVVVMSIKCRKMLGDQRWRAMAGGALLFCLLGSVPYVTAWMITRNPVFPFLNAIFRSPYFPAENFNNALFNTPFSWDTVYRITFESGDYLESYAGAAGFQWLVLVVPSLVLLALLWRRKALLLALLGLVALWLTFSTQSYLRYVLPSIVIFSAVVGVAWDGWMAAGTVSRVLAIISASTVLVLNLLFFSAATNYRDFPLQSIWGEGAKQAYLDTRLPIRKAVTTVNAMNVTRGPVVIFGPSLAGHLSAPALYPNWYNPGFKDEVAKMRAPDDLATSLLERGVSYMIIDTDWKHPFIHALVGEVSQEVARHGPIEIRVLTDKYRFGRELLKNSDFQSRDGWGLTDGATLDLERRLVEVSVESIASQLVPVKARRYYRNSVSARCGSGQGRVQVNWMDESMRFIKTDIRVFQCSSEWVEHAMEVAAPDRAAYAVVYASGHGKERVQINGVSFR